jgi:hypothetical protein
MATYQQLKQLHIEGFSPIKGKCRRRDISIETAICDYRIQGSFYSVRYAIKSNKDKVYVIKALERAKIPIIANFPNLTGHYLQYKGELTYEKAIETYTPWKNKYGIYHLLKETHRLHGDKAVDDLYAKLLEDGIPEEDIIYYNLPTKVKEAVFQQDQEAALAAVIAFYEEGHPKINFIIFCWGYSVRHLSFFNKKFSYFF